MEPLYFKLRPALPLIIIPDTLAHIDGHPVLTRTYSIFKDSAIGNPLLARSRESSLHLEEIDDPNYFGYLTFELPDKLFRYTPGQQALKSGEIEQVIEFLTDVRGKPDSWR